MLVCFPICFLSLSQIHSPCCRLQNTTFSWQFYTTFAPFGFRISNNYMVVSDPMLSHVTSLIGLLETIAVVTDYSCPFWCNFDRGILNQVFGNLVRAGRLGRGAKTSRAMWSNRITRTSSPFSTNLVHRSLLAPTALPSWTVLDRTHSAQRFSFSSYFSFSFFLFGRAVH